MPVDTYQHHAGVGHTPSYQVSGRPWVQGGTVTSSSIYVDGEYFRFPCVTKSFTVINTGAEDLVLHFYSRTKVEVMDNYHYLTVPVSRSLKLDVKTRDLYLSVAPGSAGDGDYEMWAELTSIQENYILSGSGIDD